jgi:ATP-binding cassette, subfamily F, member 3
VTQIAVSGVGVDFGATTVFDGITFTVGRGERWGIIGRNGTGKTTLMALITNTLAPTRGQVTRAPGLRVSLLEQHRDFGGAVNVWEAAAGPFAPLLELEQSLAEQANRLGELGERCTPEILARYDRDLARFEREGGYTFAPRVDAVLHGLGFDPQAARTLPIARLSGGERGRVGLARQLVSPADVILLDEPTNHLDLETTAWLEDYLRTTSETVLLISHDRAFLANVVDHVLHFENDSATPYDGGYEAFIAQRAERRLSQQRAYDKQRKVVDQEQDYIRRNIAGQNSKQAKGRRKRLERLPRLSAPPEDEGAMSIRFTPRERGGDQVVIAERATIAVGDGPAEAIGAQPVDVTPGSARVLISGFSGTVRRGDRLGIVGPNGSGKSTMLRTMLGEHPATSGEIRTGGSIGVAYYRQDLAQVPLDRTLYDVIADLRPTWERGQIQGHLGRFGFSGDEVLRRAKTLSGGERARVALAMMMLSGANLLVFDEPTNHLDVESIEALEDAVERYDGTVILVSHDRALLRALTTRVWVLHDRHVTDFDGGFGEWEVVSEERAHAARVQAEEEEALRRVREKQRVQRRDDGDRDRRDAVRRAAREVERTEGEVATLERRVAELTGRLADPDLYTQPNGGEDAARFGVELDEAKRALERALGAWERATEAADALTRG